MQTDRQKEIIERSIEIISHKGIQGLTIKNLSKEIGISEPAIYRHFESKTAILIAILRSFKEMSDMFSEMMDNHNGMANEKMNLMFSKILLTFTETPSLVSVIFSEEIFKNDTILKNQITEIQLKNQKTLETLLKKGQNEKNVRNDIDAKRLALLIMGSFRLLVKNWDLSNYDFNLINEGKLLFASLELIISSK